MLKQFPLYEFTSFFPLPYFGRFVEVLWLRSTLSVLFNFTSKHVSTITVTIFKFYHRLFGSGPGGGNKKLFKNLFRPIAILFPPISFEFYRVCPFLGFRGRFWGISTFSKSKCYTNDATQYCFLLEVKRSSMMFCFFAIVFTLRRKAAQHKINNCRCAF